MASPLEIRNRKLGETVAKKLKSRSFVAHFCETKQEAVEKILSYISESDVVSWGGSVTVSELGILDTLSKRNDVIDRDKAQTPAERVELMRMALLCDTYITSVNGISEDGELVHIDGNGNRVAAIAYGPHNIIIVAGMNKVAGSLDDAIKRARNIAAPINAQRFDLKTPCSTTGICADCKTEGSICDFIMVTRFCRVKDRIKVILVGEDLGY